MLPNYDEALHRYGEGRDLLSAALIERDFLLQELEQLTKVPQHVFGLIVAFDYARAMILVDALTKLSRDINTLVDEINIQAKICGLPHMQITSIGIK